MVNRVRVGWVSVSVNVDNYVVGTKTGAALSYVRNTLLREDNGNRAGVPDVVLTITDGTSRDNVEAISRGLRDDGVTVGLG